MDLDFSQKVERKTVLEKILIVDDLPHVRELLEVTLEVGNYQILSAETGEQALALVQAEQPDLILLDIRLPGSNLDGLEVCRRLKNDPATAKIIIILLSARAQKIDIEMGQAAGADDYFVKPFSPMALLAKIETLIKQKASPCQVD